MGMHGWTGKVQKDFGNFFNSFVNVTSFLVSFVSFVHDRYNVPHQIKEQV